MLAKVLHMFKSWAVGNSSQFWNVYFQTIGDSCFEFSRQVASDQYWKALTVHQSVLAGLGK